MDNVLLVTIDTLRTDRLGFYGDARAETPVLDRLAAAGRVYDSARAHSVMTLPSHANILTGLHPHQHGVRDNSGFRLAEDIPTAASILHEAGFATAAVVGAFPLDQRYGLARGFDLYDDEYPEGGGPGGGDPERSGQEVVARAIVWWRDHATERRFLWLHLYDPHAPYEPPAGLASRFADDPYGGEVAAVDGYLRPLLEPFLDGAEPPTLVLVTSDHGEALGEHGETTHGLFAYEATLRVPLVLWAPGLPSGRMAAAVRHVDVLPTLLAAAGVGAPEGLAGESLLDSSAGDRETYFEALTATFDRGWAPLRGIVRDGRKYIDLPLPELYDLREDPAEAVNLASVAGEKLEELKARLPSASAWPPGRGAITAEEERKLRNLGYLGGAATTKQSYGVGDDPKRLVHLDRKVHDVIDRYHRGRLEEAEQLCREVIAERPDMGVAYYYYAQVLLEAGRVPEAVEVMSRAQRRGVATPSLRRQLGLSLATLGRYEEAFAALSPLADSGDPESLDALGVVLSGAGRQAEAEQVLRRIFEIDARYPKGHETLALVALRGQDWPTAEREAERALALNDQLDQAWNYLGSARFSRGDKRGAFAAWRRATSLGADNFDALYNLALVSRELGEVDVARQALARFVRDAPPAQYGPDIEQARRWLREPGG